MRELNTVRDLTSALLAGELTTEEITSRMLERIERENEHLRAFITINKEDALRQARESDAALKRVGQRSLIHGAPIAIKDLIAVAGYPMTAGSKILGRRIAKRDADCVFACRRAGTVIIGTTNLHEFASGVTNLNPHYGYTRNPWDQERMAGGSSGGSASAVSAGLASIALGTDTSGSVRIPAALCGVVGFKPTYNAISTSGVFPLAWSLDHVGIIARSVWDAATLFSYIAREQRLPPQLDLDFKGGQKIGVPWRVFEDMLGDEERSIFQRYLDALESLGFEVLNIDIPWFQQIEGVWRVIRRAEASAVHYKWIREVPHLYGSDVLDMLRDGLKFTAVEYIVALKEKEKLTYRFESLMRGLDAMTLPTTPIAAPRIGEEDVAVGSRRLDVYSSLVAFTYQFDVTGSPALSVPIGFTRGGLPFGGQIVGRRGADYQILRIGYAYELVVEGFKHKAPLY